MTNKNKIERDASECKEIDDEIHEFIKHEAAKQYDLIDEITSLTENKDAFIGMKPLNTLGKGWYIYHFSSYGFDGKYNNTDGVSGEVKVERMNLKLRDDPNMSPLASHEDDKGKYLHIYSEDKMKRSDMIYLLISNVSLLVIIDMILNKDQIGYDCQFHFIGLWFFLGLLSFQIFLDRKK